MTQPEIHIYKGVRTDNVYMRQDADVIVLTSYQARQIVDLINEVLE